MMETAETYLPYFEEKGLLGNTKIILLNTDKKFSPHPNGPKYVDAWYDLFNLNKFFFT